MNNPFIQPFVSYWRLVLILMGYVPCFAQTTPTSQTLTLDQCYTAATETSPLQRQNALTGQSGKLTLDNLTQTRRLPQLTMNGQASWQSEVTSLALDIPNVNIPKISKDQYKLTLDASYVLFDGGLLARQLKAQEVGTALEQQRVAVQISQLKDQVNALYMNVLLTEANQSITQLLRQDLVDRIGKIQANVKFGAAAPLNADVLEAELLKTDQRLNELATSRRGLRDALALLTGLSITDATVLTTPTVTDGNTLSLQRPELKLYALQKQATDAQFLVNDGRRTPRLSAFAQPGFGRPGLNFLNNDVKGFFTGGLRLSWNIGQNYTLRNDRKLLALQNEQTDSQQANFEKNLTVQLRQQQTEIDRVASLLGDDEKIVTLRSKIRKTTAVQLDNGVIAARDYVNELNAENQAIQNQKLHELQLLLAKVNYRTLTGN